MGIVFEWFAENWLQVLQGAGIIGGLVFTGCSLRLNAKTQRVQTLINLTQQHRTIWLKFIESPKLKGIFTGKGKSREPTENERLFLNLLFLHLSSTLAAVEAGIIPEPEGLGVDYEEILKNPVPLKVWRESQQYHDRRTRRFIEKILKAKEADRGFTLVELSIVLVIVGLLVGGILVARSMIETARVKSVIRSVSQYEAAAMNFRTTYRQIPGDSSLFPNPGDNNGRVHTSGWMYGNCSTSRESYNFWRHLHIAGHERISYPGTNGTTCVSPNLDGNVPVLDVGRKAYLSAGTVFPTAPQFTSDWTNAFWISSATGGAVLSAPTALAIDRKLDDGNPIGGAVQIMYVYTGPYLGTTTYSGNCAVVSTWPQFRYNIALAAAECALVFKASW